VSERALRRLLEATPVDPGAEERAWAVVAAAHAQRERLPRARRPARAVLAFAAAAAAITAAALSPPGRAVVHAVRKSIGIEHAQPALFRLPAPGRVLVSGPGGAWVVAADGSKRRLGEFREASWSPHALYVLASASNELAALEPGGRVHWTLARRDIRFARWGGSRADTRVAYLTGSQLRILAGDGTGDRPLGPAAPVAPAWRPGDAHVLAYVDPRERVLVVDTDRRALTRLPGRYPDARSLTWSPDGHALVLVTARTLVRFDLRTGSTHTLLLPGIRAIAFSRAGRLAVVRGGSVFLVAGESMRTLFATQARLAGLAWSPDGRWLLTGLPAADQWIFLQTHGGRRVLAVSHLTAQFGGLPQLDGWAPSA
jgi:hypothetical protein